MPPPHLSMLCLSPQSLWSSALPDRFDHSQSSHGKAPNHRWLVLSQMPSLQLTVGPRAEPWYCRSSDSRNEIGLISGPALHIWAAMQGGRLRLNTCQVRLQTMKPETLMPLQEMAGQPRLTYKDRRDGAYMCCPQVLLFRKRRRAVHRKRQYRYQIHHYKYRIYSTVEFK